MRRRQAGLSLVAVALAMAALAALAMAALFSMRHERNLFAEGWRKVAGPGAPAIAAQASGPESSTAPLRKCTIDGRTVISNTECGHRGKVIAIHDSHGIEAPKAPPAPAEPQQGLREKMLERAMP
ncbi:DUF4124 domain-containing protein [Pseudoduganella buxea]|uniref:DUF4124 domain-containing protein n=1 Tax=Pseudoduganella buxea TaxID=1949069 RepID=A0A6I3SVT6_9BURK|nr:DUF4124 domain-containing protein [Pseudoduganella buxea]MTV51867.1 DUF4124 domain-containing protein [Pseudoduganella buxea]GGB98607.1 hypothetical protein GCM10011572_20670 [Pseudoduganella buxea]